MPSTATVFCEVTEVMTEVPKVSSEVNVLRSAWIPAPLFFSMGIREVVLGLDVDTVHGLDLLSVILDTNTR